MTREFSRALGVVAAVLCARCNHRRDEHVRWTYTCLEPACKCQEFAGPSAFERATDPETGVVLEWRIP